MLPNGWIERLFTRLQIRYGSAWSAKWAGLDEAIIRADWSQQLSGFANHAWAIQYALDNLPATAYPPTAAEFRELCRAGLERQEASAAPALPAPVDPVPEYLRERLSRIGREPKMPRAWIGVLRAQQAAGHRLSAAQLDALAWADANDGAADPAPMGEFTPIPDHLLPPGMRKEVAR